jgi:hypothetical protein
MKPGKASQLPRQADSSASYKTPSTGTGFKTRLWERYKWELVPLAGFYLLFVVFFAPVVFQGKRLSPAADMVAAAGMYKMGEEAISSGHFPLWNPTLFSGLPLFASLQYALFVYPPEYFIRAFSHIFGGGDYRIWVFHFFLAAWLAYLLARHYGCGRLSAWVAGIAYGFTPQLIVLADVGHGSKIMAMTWLPLIWLMMERLRARPSLGRMSALGAVFAVQIMALHPQVAAYGAMLMGLHLIFWGVIALREKSLPEWGKLIGWFSGAMALSLALSAILWVSVLDYARFSTRGGSGGGDAVSTGGGVSWDYATGWSFHPVESITYLFPSYFGFGNETYWGTVGTPDGTPFTHNPMYFGVVVLLLAVLAMTITPKRVWGFALALALAAWALSWGRYLPLLYSPFYHLLPMFNKFRAPVMGQILLALPMALLAGVGLEALISRVREGNISKRFVTVLGWIAVVAAFKAVISLVAPGMFSSLYLDFAKIVNPTANSQVVTAARDLAHSDVIRVLFIVAGLLGLTVAAMKKHIPAALLTGVFVLVMLVDLWPVNTKLVSFTPASSVQSLFQPDPVVNRLKKDNDKFRLAALDGRYKPANWWSYFGIETVGGYFGAKPGAYQKLMTASGLESWEVIFSNPKILDALNVRYVQLSFPLDRLFEELQRQGRGAPARPANQWQLEIMPRDMRPGSGPFLYSNMNALPRARMVGDYRVIPDVDATIQTMVGRSNWEPSLLTLLDRDPSIQPAVDPTAAARITLYQAEKIVIETNSSQPQILVLADEYYPSGWNVTIDAVPGEILRADGVLRGVALPAGSHKVEFVFHPRLFYLGLWVSLISLLMVVGVAVWTVTKGKKA